MVSQLALADKFLVKLVIFKKHQSREFCLPGDLNLFQNLI